MLRNSSGHLVIECGGNVEPTCDINCITLASAYTVLGVDALIGCAQCLNSAFPPWNGVLEQVEDICQWMLNYTASIDSKFPSFSLKGMKIDCEY